MSEDAAKAVLEWADRVVAGFPTGSVPTLGQATIRVVNGDGSVEERKTVPEAAPGAAGAAN